MKRTNRSWSDYYRVTSARPPRALLLEAVSRFDRPGFAIDLGCGAGNEALELLRQGWQVLALDREPAAIEHLLEVVPSKDRMRLETAVVSFEEMTLPPADLIWSGTSLSFTAPAVFDKVWGTILGALKAGGRLACDLFGPRHAWASKGMTTLTEQQVRERLSSLEVELFEERAEEAQTAFQGLQHWHAFDVIAWKPPNKAV